MKLTRRIHLSYIVTFLALLSLGATFAVRAVLDEITSPANINGAEPEVRFLDTGLGDPDWEIEGVMNNLQFDLDQSAGRGIFNISAGANEDTLTLDINGNVAINGELAGTAHELEVFGNSGAADTLANIALTPGAGDSSIRMSANTSSGADSIVVTSSGTYASPFVMDLSVPQNALSIAGDGDIGFGINRNSIDPASDLHIIGEQVLLDTAGATADCLISPSADSLSLVNVGSFAPVRFFNGAPTHSLVVAGDGSIGGDTVTPDARLHIFRNDGTASLKVEEISGTVAVRQMMNLVNNGGIQFSLENSATRRRGEFQLDLRRQCDDLWLVDRRLIARDQREFPTGRL